MGDFERAAQAIGAFLLFNSSHREMLQNRLFFMTRLGYHDSHLSARKVNRKKVIDIFTSRKIYTEDKTIICITFNVINDITFLKLFKICLQHGKGEGGWQL